jgi:uncharacterized small protein (DUF1192 family)
MNVTLEALKEIIGGLYVENLLLRETVQQLQAQLKKKDEPEKPADSLP